MEADVKGHIYEIDLMIEGSVENWVIGAGLVVVDLQVEAWNPVGKVSEVISKSSTVSISLTVTPLSGIM